MNLNRRLRTSKRIWLIISLLLFVAAWFLRGGKGGNEPMSEIWRVLLTHDYICSDFEMLMSLSIYTLAFAVPAVLAGWILQFPICMGLDYFHRVRTDQDSNPPQHGAGRGPL